MADKSKISWTDRTENFWEGCTKVGPGCDHCYAEDRANRWQSVIWGAGQPRRRTAPANRRKPLTWNERHFVECMACGHRCELRECAEVDGRSVGGFYPPAEGKVRLCPNCEEPQLKETRQRVFCSSLSDWLDNEVPAAWRIEMLWTIWKTPALDWMLLTKRIGNFRRLIEEVIALVTEGSPEIPPGVQAEEEQLAEWLRAWLAGQPPANVWIGATIVTPDEAKRDIPKLVDVPAVVRFLSMEPLLAEVNLAPWLFRCCGNHVVGAEYMGQQERLCCGDLEVDPHVDWVIVGAESGHAARPLHVDWIRKIVDQCKRAGVAVHVKQLGHEIMTTGIEQPGEKWPAGTAHDDRGGGIFWVRLKHVKGGDPAEWPEDLRVQDFPIPREA